VQNKSGRIKLQSINSLIAYEMGLLKTPESEVVTEFLQERNIILIRLVSATSIKMLSALKKKDVIAIDVTRILSMQLDTTGAYSTSIMIVLIT
jgi:hypothetical protein